MANYSRGWAGTVEQPSSSDTWSNLAGATVSDDNWATCSIFATQDSEWLIATNFAFQRAVPSGASVVGVTVLIEGYSTISDFPIGDPTFVALQGAKLVIGGTIQTGGPSVGIGRPLGRGSTPERYELLAGGETDLWGQTPTQAQAAASNFGVALNFRAIGADFVARVDSIRMIIWWEKDPACVITPISPTSGKQAPFQFVAHANNSTWDDRLPQEVSFKWEVEGPEGWLQTVEDPRRGGWEDATRDLAVLWGKCPQWLFDVPGEYTINCTMYRTNDNGTFATTAATPVTVTVDSNTRTKYYVSSAGDDGNLGNGPASTQAWKTLHKASVSAGKDNSEVIVTDGETIEEEDIPDFEDFTNLWIHRSGTGSTPPTITNTAEISLSEFRSCDDTVIQGLKFQYNSAVSGSRPWAMKPSNVKRFCVVDTSHNGCDSFCEIQDSGLSEGVFLLRCDSSQHRRYMLYAGGEFARYVAVIGGVWHTDRGGAAEGHLRMNNCRIDTSKGVGLFMAFVQTSAALPITSGTHSCCRHGWSEQDVYANRFGLYSSFSLAHNPDGSSVHWEMNSRYEANDMDYGLSMPWGDRSMYALMASNYLRVKAAEKVGDPGISLSYRYYLNTLVMSDDSGGERNFWQIRSDGALHDGFSHVLAGNLWVTEQVPGNTSGTWTFMYWRNSESRSMGATFSHNVYNDDGAGAGTTPRWKELDTNYNLTGWNGLAIAANEIEVTPLHGGSGGTLPQAAYSWGLDPTAFSATRHVPPNAIRGVFFDYRLIERNPNVSSGFWASGCTGDEP